jgi:hypothetical protein
VKMPEATTSSTARPAGRDATPRPQGRSQRELVAASLLRCPPPDRPAGARTCCATR